MQAYPHFSKRQVEILDGIWDFHFLGEDADVNKIDLKKISYDELMPVPGVFDATPKYPGKRGTALYRKIVSAAPNTRMKLKIGGLGLWAKVFWDGKDVGTIDLLYSGIELEFKSGKGNEHELVILIDNRLDFKRTPLFSQYYDFYGYGGIYRSVELHQLSECSIERARIKTLDISTGRIAVDIELSGKIPDKFNFELSFDNRNKKSFSKPTDAGHVRFEINVPDFKLWSPEKPCLHTLTVTIENDSITERFGIRTVTTEKGQIKLNGHSVRLLGYCRHESHPEFGPAQPLGLLIEDLQYLKDLGCNFVRGTHYPMDERFLDLCDQLGIMIWEESLAWGNQPHQLEDKNFCESQRRQTALMVRNSFNHPAIIIWGFMNEGPTGMETSREFYKSMFDTVRKEDSSRPVTYASNWGIQDVMFDLADIISLNTYPGWYAVDKEKIRPLNEIEPRFEEFIKFIDGKGFKDKPFIISEIGAGAIYGWHDRFRVHWSEEYQADYLECVCNYVKKTKRVSGISLWHFADARTYTSSYALGRPRAINDKGTLDEFRRPKMAYEIVKKAFTEMQK